MINSLLSIRQTRALNWLMALAVSLFAGLPSQAWAATVCGPGHGATTTLTLPAVSVARDAPVGTILATGSWQSQTAIYTCVIGAMPLNTGIGVKTNTTLTKVGTVTINSVPLTEYATNVPGVGIAFAARLFLGNVNACGLQPTVLDTGGLNAPAGGILLGYVWSQCNDTGTQTQGLNATAWLVKTGQVAQGGTVSFSGTVLLTNGIVASALNTPNTTANFVISPVAVTVQACTTGNVSVPLGQYRISAFTGVGSATPAVKFTVPVNNCPAGLTSIGLQFTATSTVLSATNGVIALDSTSTATGIGLKLTNDSNNLPLTFGAPGYTVAAYNPTTGGSFVATFDAAYYQTATTITPGTANASMLFTLSYQ